ncbi:DUF1697 domain-containing protein [Aquicoccus sp. SCR17]|nr:DUF1697 domain-containing protein [Carideicomes alvinocaridis]
MARFVALLRGINVGGANRLPMGELRAICGRLGWRGVQSYVASGNLVFEAEGEAGALAETLSDALAAEKGLEVQVAILPGAEIRAALEACPFAPEDDRQVHVCFLLSDPKLDETLLDRLRVAEEVLQLEGRRAFLHTPSGFGRSKLAARLERVVGAPLTARNLRTLRKLVEMLDGPAAG